MQGVTQGWIPREKEDMSGAAEETEARPTTEQSDAAVGFLILILVL